MSPSPKNTNDRVTSILFGALSTLVSILFAGNIYFVSGTLEKIDKRLEVTETRVNTLQEHVAVLTAIIDNLRTECRGSSRQKYYPGGMYDPTVQEGRSRKGL